MTAPTGQGQAPPDPPAAPPAAPTPSSEEGTLAQRVEAIEGKLDQLLNRAHGQAAQHTEARLDRGTAMEEAAAREVARLRQEDADKAARDQDKATLTQVQADVAALKETPPEPPLRRIEKFMWPGSRRRD